MGYREEDTWLNPGKVLLSGAAPSSLGVPWTYHAVRTVWTGRAVWAVQALWAVQIQWLAQAAQVLPPTPGGQNRGGSHRTESSGLPHG